MPVGRGASARRSPRRRVHGQLSRGRNAAPSPPGRRARGAPRAAVLFIDGKRARFIALTSQEVGEEVVLESADVVGHHRRGGWAMLLQSRYQRHIQEHRARHFEAVAAACRHGRTAGPWRRGPGRRATESRRVPRPPALDGGGADRRDRRRRSLRGGKRVREPGPRADPARGRGQPGGHRGRGAGRGQGGGRAASGVDATVEAVNRGTVDRLYILRSWEEAGRVCPACGALQREFNTACRWCGKPTSAVSLGEAIVQRVIAADGTVESAQAHAVLERAGGVAALLRYPPT